jgi:hypothetical protein
MQLSNSKKGNRYSEDFKKQLYELNLNGNPFLHSQANMAFQQEQFINGFQS